MKENHHRRNLVGLQYLSSLLADAPLAAVIPVEFLSLNAGKLANLHSSFGSSETAYCRDIFLYLSAKAVGEITKISADKYKNMSLRWSEA